MALKGKKAKPKAAAPPKAPPKDEKPETVRSRSEVKAAESTAKRKRKASVPAGGGEPAGAGKQKKAKKEKLPWYKRRVPFNARSGPWKDRTLKCHHCDADFTFTAGRQEVFAQTWEKFEPEYCKPCEERYKLGMARRKAMEESKLCLVCKSPTHEHPTCPQGCFNCDQRGHASSACPTERRCWKHKMGWCGDRDCPQPHVR
eukprot:EG_transcript_22094